MHVYVREWVGAKSGLVSNTVQCNMDRNNPSYRKIHEAFCYSDKYNGFGVFLASADGQTVNQGKLDALKQLRWIDKNTVMTQVKIESGRTCVIEREATG